MAWLPDRCWWTVAGALQEDRPCWLPTVGTSGPALRTDTGKQYRRQEIPVWPVWSVDETLAYGGGGGKAGGHWAPSSLTLLRLCCPSRTGTVLFLP